MAGSSDTIRNLLACVGCGDAGWVGPRQARYPATPIKTAYTSIRALRSLAGKPEVVLGGVGGDPRRCHEERLAPAAHAPCVAGRQVDGRKEVRRWVGVDRDLDRSGCAARHSRGQEPTEHPGEPLRPWCADRAGTPPNTRKEQRGEPAADRSYHAWLSGKDSAVLNPPIGGRELGADTAIRRRPDGETGV